MQAITIFSYGVRTGLVCLALALSFIVGSFASGLATSAAQPLADDAAAPLAGESETTLPPLLVVCVCVGVVISYLIARSGGVGWRLMGAVFLGVFGFMTVLSQIESLVYLRHKMSLETIGRISMMGLVASALFAPLAVLIWAAMRRAETTSQIAPRAFSVKSWIWRLAFIGLAHLALYMIFGYYVAWRSPAVREFYGGTDPGSFFAMMEHNWRTAPWNFFLQFGRGILCALFVLPLLHMLPGSRLESAFSMALFFAVWSTLLLLPNPFMPDDVARVHFIETLLSNLMFGGFVGWLFSRNPQKGGEALLNV